MKALTFVAGVVGLALALLLIQRSGFGEVLRLLQGGGWLLLWLVPFHLLPLALDAEAWRQLLAPRDPERRASLPFLLWIATVREAVNRLLPVANIGGEIIGIRLVLRRRLDGAAVAASVIVEVLLTMVNQYLFTALGLLLLMAVTQVALGGTILTGLALSLPVPLALIWLLRHGAPFARLESFAIRLLGDDHQLTRLTGGAGLDREIRLLSSRRRVLAVALVWQFAGYLLGSFETWFALEVLGHPVAPWAAVAIEAMTQAVRHFVFFVPAGLGVQEAGLVLFGQLAGVGMEAAVALSLAKRLREVLFGLPALISWQWAAARRPGRMPR